ncbi:Arf guanine nucleotide exchange factor sec74 [Schizosaccharomyces pombe 972h-] [Rhizoctonia solani]|uniref:Arf guanine nucleotide exchange factor sec74 [Schizosaccharomyces pombe 972h-] n=1 Tax=Rhizoctonia solani TaxID=456999 RepID=A0A0K6G5Y7_9AGAM|nr:Arf guanine nucleotide exchange factor sec74 [Schizosaccharomyces pombe 972h-] [Rhizoctonia solani]
MNKKDGPLPYSNSNGDGAVCPWVATPITTTTTTTSAETHFFPLFRRKQNNPTPQTRIDTGRDKALPPPPDEDGIRIGTPRAHVSSRNITPRPHTQRDRNVTPTPPFPPFPTVTPPTPIAQRKPSKDIRKVRSSGTLRDILPPQPRRSEHTDRDRTAPYPDPPIVSPPRGRQTAVSSPSLSQAGRTLSPPVAPTRQTMAYTSSSQPWLDREQGRLAWESRNEFGLVQPGAVTSHSLGSRDQNQHRERARRPSAPASPNVKGKVKDIEPIPQDTPSRRSILGRRPSFWSRKPKSKPGSASAAVTPEALSPAAKRSLEVPKVGSGPSRSSSLEDPTSPRSSTYSPRPGASSHSSVHRINSRPSTDKISALQQSSNNSRLSLSSPRASVESRQSFDHILPNVRPTTPLFTEFGAYRASVDFAAAGGPSLMARSKRIKGDGQVITEGVPTAVSHSESTSSQHPTESTPIPIPGTHTPPRRRMTNNGSVGRAQSWRRSLVESARNLIGASSSASLDGGDEILSGSPAQGLVGSPAQGSPLGTASSSPIPWVNISTSPRASGSRCSPARPLAIVSSPPPITSSLRSRHGSPIPSGMMSPTNAQRVTFGDDPQPSRGRTGSMTAAISNWRGNSSPDEGNGANRGIRRAKSTSKLTATLPLTRRRSFSLFGSRPGSAGQAKTQAQVAREREMKGSALGHSHPSAFGPATDPGLTLTLSPPMLTPGSVFASPQAMPLEAPGTPATPLTGSQLSLGGPSWGGSSIGHGAGSQFGSNTNISGTTTAGVSRTSSILLRSPLRPRSITNPPLLRRLSGVFGSGSGTAFPRNASGDMLGAGARQSEMKQGDSLVSSPKRGSSGKPVTVTRAEGDTPEIFLRRLLETVSKSEIANAIASKNDPFHSAALALYMQRFNFVLEPLDIALRRLLMDLSLPKETQQIDRVMEAFAKRYTDCNPGLFASEDQAYVLAFSLMMLHTDAFNKNNKNKMTKVDYVKNTRMPGLPPEVLDYFFDNIVFAPFIFIEDATDVNGQRGFVDRGSVTPVSNPNSSGTLLPARTKIDPYYIITQNLLDPLRVPTDLYVPPVSPLSYTGTTDSLDAVQLRQAFASNSQLEIAGTGAGPVRIGVNKLGLLLRKDDLLEGGRRAVSRKWRRWAVVLTGSQLLLFRETAWALLDPQHPSAETSSLRPEEVVSLKDAIALYDMGYDKYTNVFRFILPTGRQQLLQATNEQDMNEWIARINYASALKSAGVRVRELAMNAEESRATGVAAAVSHVRDQRRGKASPPSWSNEELDSTLPPGPKIMGNRSGMSSQVELDVIVEPSDGGMKDTFDEIKAQLATSHPFPINGLAPPTPSQLRGQDKTRTRMTTRAEVIVSKIKALDEKINSAQENLQNELRITRNFAVLAPFQQATRNRIRLALEGLAKRVRVIRMDVAKMACHRDVLAADLAADEEEREQLRMIALEAAREQLLLTVPRMMLSVHDEEDEPERRPSPAASDASASRASPAWSFRSTTDYPDDPTLVAKRDTSLTTPEIENEQLAPPRKSEVSLQARPSFAASVSSRSGISSNGDPNGHPAGSGTAVTEEGTEELAEEWHATRAGRRVSLVEIPQPSDKQKLAELIRQHAHSKQTIDEGETSS